MSDFAVAFLSAIIICGVFRTTMGQIVLRENGRWTFRFRRFDEYDEMMTARVNEALDIGYRSGITAAARFVEYGDGDDETRQAIAAGIRRLKETGNE